MTFLAARRLDLRPVRLRRSRLLSSDGRVVVHVGEPVDPERIVARGTKQVEPIVIGLARELGVSAKDIGRYLQCRAGVSVGLDQVLATRGGPLGFRPRVVRAPVAGIVREVLEETAELVLIPEAPEGAVSALLPGVVAAHLGRRGVVIETTVLRAEGLVGIGSLVSGPLVPVGDSTDHDLRADDLGPRVRGAVLLVGSIGADAVVAAYHGKVAGIVAGTCRLDQWNQIVQLATAPSVVVLEGFGDTGLSALAWDGLRRCAGWNVVLDAACEHPEASWPELLVPVEATGEREVAPPDLTSGSFVRICRGPLAPRVAEVVRVGRFPARLGSGLVHPWVEVSVNGRPERVSQRAIEFVASGR